MYLNMRIFDIPISEDTPNIISFPFNKEFIDTLNDMSDDSETSSGRAVIQEMVISFRYCKKITDRLWLSKNKPGKERNIKVIAPRAVVDRDNFTWKGCTQLKDCFLSDARTSPIQIYRLERLYDVSVAPSSDLPLLIHEEDPLIKKYIKERLKRCSIK